MFEAFQVPALFVINQTILNLYASGQASGCVLESGESESYISSVVEGVVLPHTLLHLGLAGRHLNDYLIDLLSKGKGYHFASISMRDIAQDIKEKLCYVAEDFNQEIKNAANGYDSE
eukprot:2326417-Ditylum_brightwellii.AAC.1